MSCKVINTFVVPLHNGQYVFPAMVYELHNKTYAVNMPGWDGGGMRFISHEMFLNASMGLVTVSQIMAANKTMEEYSDLILKSKK